MHAISRRSTAMSHRGFILLSCPYRCAPHHPSPCAPCAMTGFCTATAPRSCWWTARTSVPTIPTARSASTNIGSCPIEDDEDSFVGDDRRRRRICRVDFGCTFRFAGNRKPKESSHVRITPHRRPSSPSPTRSSIDSRRAILSSRPRRASPATNVCCPISPRRNSDATRPRHCVTCRRSRLLESHSDVDRIAKEVLRERLSVRLALLEADEYRRTFSVLSSPVSAIRQVFELMAASTPDDATHIAARLAAVRGVTRHVARRTARHGGRTRAARDAPRPGHRRSGRHPRGGGVQRTGQARRDDDVGRPRLRRDSPTRRRMPRPRSRNSRRSCALTSRPRLRRTRRAAKSVTSAGRRTGRARRSICTNSTTGATRTFDASIRACGRSRTNYSPVRRASWRWPNSWTMTPSAPSKAATRCSRC